MEMWMVITLVVVAFAVGVMSGMWIENANTEKGWERAAYWQDRYNCLFSAANEQYTQVSAQDAAFGPGMNADQRSNIALKRMNEILSAAKSPASPAPESAPTAPSESAGP